jgi:hypothetical protein
VQKLKKKKKKKMGSEEQKKKNPKKKQKLPINPNWAQLQQVILLFYLSLSLSIPYTCFCVFTTAHVLDFIPCLQNLLVYADAAYSWL